MHSQLRHYMEVSGQLHAPAALFPNKEPQYSFNRRLSGSKRRSERGEEIKPLSLQGIEPQSSRP
jgi:hypothetical protein